MNRRFRVYGRALAAVSLVWLIVASACAPQAQQAPPGQQAAQAAQGQPASKPAAATTTKSELVFASKSDALTINPLDSIVIVPDSQITRNLYDSLVELDADGNVIAGLATAWERTDPLTIRLQLRQGVKFHNGEDFSAEDVRWTFTEVLNPDKKYKWGSSFAFVDRVEVVDRYTVNVITKRPHATAIRQLARQGIVSAAYAQASPEILNTRPNGTGPYKFVEWVKDTRLVTEAFDGHWRGAPPIRRVVWRGINEDAARVAALVRGEIDVAHSVPSDLAPQINGNATTEVRAVPAQRTYWLKFVNGKPELPTAKKEVRQAINYAIDREELNRELFDNKALTMATAVHPLSLGYDPQHKWGYDPQRARELLARAGYPNGLTITMQGSDGRYARDRELTHAIAGQLARAGINVQVKTMEVGQWTDAIFNKTSDPLVLMAFGDADRDRTSNFSISHRTGQLWSIISYPELDALIDRTEGTLDDGQRAQVMKDVQVWMMENAPGAYLMTLIDNYGANKALSWKPRPDDVLNWREASFTR